VYRSYLELSEVKQFELGTGELEKLRLEPDDLLIVEGNGSATEIGRCARWKGEINNCVHQNHIIRCRPGNKKISQFVELFLNSSLGIEIMMTLAVTSAGLYNLSVGKIRKIPFPLPPLAEQHRIVAKVDQLITICDQLETAIEAQQHATSRLLDALIAEALADSPEPQSVEAGVQLALGF
jgi:type I restriction enzyme S subunit